MLINSLLFASLCAVTAAAVLRFDLDRVKSPVEQLVAAGKWREYREARKLSAQRNQPLDNYNGLLTMNLTVGTPPQVFLVNLDFNSSLLWVPDEKCPSAKKCQGICSDATLCAFLCVKECCSKSGHSAAAPPTTGCEFRRKFNSKTSMTYQRNGTAFTYQPWGAPSSSGFMGIDTVLIGNYHENNFMQIPSSTFGQAVSANFDDMSDTFDGVLGLGPNTLLPGNVPLLLNAFNQGFIDAPIYTIWLKSGVQTGFETDTTIYADGQITYGGVDKQNCGAVQGVYHNVLPGATNFTLSLDSVGMGGSRQDPTGAWTATFDVTSAYALAGPRSLISMILAQSGLSQDQIGSDDEYAIRCDAKLPKLSLTFDGVTYEVDGSQLILSFTPGDCILGVADTEQPDSNANIILGAPFVHQFCLVADLTDGAAKLGFAPNVGPST